MPRWLISLCLFTTLQLGVFACNSAETTTSETSDAEPNNTNDGTDEPAWVNSMYLTCDWDSIESRSKVGVACSVASTDPALNPTLARVESKNWRTIDSSGKIVDSESRKRDQTNIFILQVQSISSLSPQVTLSDGKFIKIITTRFEDLLEGLNKEGKLDACFNAEISIDECFKAVSINLPNGDRFRNTNSVNSEESACSNKDTLPTGVPCELTSHGMAGDLDQARNWYVLGNDLITIDGTLKSRDFCDASGIKPTTTRGATSIKSRWYPHWKVGTKPCFARFRPGGSHPTYDQKLIVYDRKDGIGGEPFCMFAAMQEPSIFGGTIIRMHIFKNPKLFPDAAAAGSVSLSELEDFAEHFACVRDPF